jgi:hypothetical protein
MTTPNRPPLWEEMQAAYFKGREPGLNDRHGYAAEILALRDWLKSELPEGGAWHVLLTAEADRAERGDA